MVEQLEDRGFKKVTEVFPEATIKFLGIDYDMVVPYPSTIFLTEKCEQRLDNVFQIYENKLLDLEYHSTDLQNKPLGRYDTYKTNLRVVSKKFTKQQIICTGDPDKSKRTLLIDEGDECKFDIYFPLEDDADEKIKILEDIINNNRKIASDDVEVMYLTYPLYMKSELSDAELLYKIADLTNQVKGLNEDELDAIKIFQKAFMVKYIPRDHELYEEIENMVSIEDIRLMEELFPDACERKYASVRNEGIEIGRKDGIEIGRKNGIEIGRKESVEDVAKEMIGLNYSFDEISRVTGLSIKRIGELL